MPDTPTPTPKLDSLPTEIHLQIFSHLNICDSTCLGLANKKFYGIHYSIYSNYGPVDLLHKVGDRYLYKAIREWMLPVWIWDPLPAKFRKEANLSGFDRWRLYGREEEEEEEEDGDSEREEEGTPNEGSNEGGENKEDNEGTLDDGRKKAGGDGKSHERVKKVEGYTPQQYAEVLRFNRMLRGTQTP